MPNRYQTTRESFRATVQNHKNRQVAIPAGVQRRLGLARREDNHALVYSIRPAGRGPWFHHISFLTFDNEFAVPASFSSIGPGSQVEVKIHAALPNVDVLGGAPCAGHVLEDLAREAGDDPRADGSERVDDYLAGEGP